jgi:L-amino acid N-acyltransferase YncA
VAADNAPSLWMFEKAGFRNAGTLHDWLLRADGGYVDALQMQLIVD